MMIVLEWAVINGNPRLVLGEVRPPAKSGSYAQHCVHREMLHNVCESCAVLRRAEDRQDELLEVVRRLACRD
jgi:hypothetical protein